MLITPAWGSIALSRSALRNPERVLTYIKQDAEPVGDGGDQYTGWDRFSRVIDQRWIKTSTGTALERPGDGGWP